MNAPKGPYSVGLDIGSAAIKVVHVEGDLVLREVITPLPSGVVSRNRVEDVEQLATILRDLFRREGLPTDNVHLAFSEIATFGRTVNLPYTGNNEKLLRAAIETNASEIMQPINPATSTMAWNEVERRDKSVSLAIIAASRMFMQQLLEATKKAKIKVVRAEPSATALSNTLMPDEEALLAIDVGSQVTTWAIIANGHIRFLWSIPKGTRDMVSAIAGIAMVTSVHHAERLLISYGLDQPHDNESMILEAQAAAFVVADQLMTEIDTVMEHYRTLPEATQFVPMRLAVFGGGALVPGLAQMISEYTMLPVIEPVYQQQAAECPHLELYAAALGAALSSDVNVIPRDRGRVKIKSSGAMPKTGVKVEKDRDKPRAAARAYIIAVIATALIIGAGLFADRYVSGRSDEVAKERQAILAKAQELQQANQWPVALSGPKQLLDANEQARDILTTKRALASDAANIIEAAGGPGHNFTLTSDGKKNSFSLQGTARDDMAALQGALGSIGQVQEEGSSGSGGTLDLTIVRHNAPGMQPGVDTAVGSAP